MTYNSVAEIYDSLEQARARLRRSVEGLTPEQERFKPDSARWSIAELVEHIAASETSLLGLFRKMLARAEAERLRREEGAPFAPVSLERFAERSRQKFEAPEMIRPAGDVPIADSLARLEQSSAELRGLRAGFETFDCSRLRFPHPAFGPLDLYEWLAFNGAHEARHVAQIRALRSELPAAS
ncbi:MAG TPA: DinB family protein [Pyrinomonadaceae bacterium]|nr:DinB family protein [Pyrinomonadaceae bacterium]